MGKVEFNLLTISVQFLPRYMPGFQYEGLGEGPPWDPNCKLLVGRNSFLLISSWAEPSEIYHKEEHLIHDLLGDDGESDMQLAKLKHSSKPGDSLQVETATYIKAVTHILLILFLCVALILLRLHPRMVPAPWEEALLKEGSHLLPCPVPKLHSFSEEGPYLEIYGLLCPPVLSQSSIPFLNKLTF